MKINIKEKTAVILVAAMLLPVLSSCSLFSKKAVLTAAGDFGEVIKTADASDILRKTDGTDRDYKKSFKDFLIPRTIRKRKSLSLNTWSVRSNIQSTRSP